MKKVLNFFKNGWILGILLIAFVSFAGRSIFTSTQADRGTSIAYLNDTCENVGWDDLRFDFARTMQGATAKPDFSYTNNGLLFPQNDTTEITYIIAQFPHDRKNGSSISPHVHFIQTSADVPVFGMQYRWYDNRGQVTSFIQTYTNSLAFTYTTGSMLQIAEFPDIAGALIDTVSSMMDIRIYRKDNVVSGDVLAKEFDIHYQINQDRGSRTEYVK